MIPNAFITTLKNSLTEGGNETEVFVNDIKTQDGDTIDISDFAKLGNVGYLIIDNGTSRAEYIKFTGIDTVNKKFTGITRGLSFRANNDNRVNANVKFHPAGAAVEIVNNTHYLNHFVDKNSNETIGGVKTFTSIPILPAQNPTNDNEAARKAYVDAVGSGAVGSASETAAGKVKLDKPSSVDARVIAVFVHQQATPNMTLYVEPLNISGTSYVINFNGGNSPAFSAPTTNPRIDLLVYDTTSSQLAIRQGTEAVSPTPPTPNNGDYVICSVYHRVGETSIKDKDDGTNGYILRHYIGDVYEPSSIVKTTGNQTIGGVKTFTSIPVLPGTDPTNDNEASRKAYVDNLAKGIISTNSIPVRKNPTIFVGSSYDVIRTDCLCLVFDNSRDPLSPNRNTAVYIRLNVSGTSGTLYFEKYIYLPKSKYFVLKASSSYSFSFPSSPSNWYLTGAEMIGNYLYVGYYYYITSDNWALLRFNLSDLTYSAKMTGTAPYHFISDGTYLYDVMINTFRKLSISGTTISVVSTITLSSSSNRLLRVEDGSLIYAITASGSNIQKFNFSGTLLKTSLSVDFIASDFFNEFNGYGSQFIHGCGFLTQGMIFGLPKLAVLYDWNDNTAKTQYMSTCLMFVPIDLEEFINA